MWIIASIPLWILGALFVGAALVGGGISLKSDRTSKDVSETAIGFCSLMVAATIVLVLAAKVAS